MDTRTLQLIARERADRITPTEHYELLEALRPLGLTMLEAVQS